MIELSTLYPYEEKKDKTKISKFAILNCVIGIPTISFLIFLLVKELFVEYLAVVYSAIGVLGVGVIYSIFKLIKR